MGSELHKIPEQAFCFSVQGDSMWTTIGEFEFMLTTIECPQNAPTL